MTEEQNIRNLIKEKTPADALETLNAALQADAGDATLLIERGKLLWRMNRRGEAMSDYEKAAQLDPAGPARLLLEHSNAIMDFFNPDLLNP